MSIDLEHSLVRYDYYQVALRQQSTAVQQPAASRISTPARRFPSTADASLYARPIRQGRPPLTYSLQRTAEAPPVANGQMVDIFV